MGISLPVMVEIARPDGSQELVRVGTARRDGSYFVLDLGSLRIGAAPPVSATAPMGMGTVEDLEYIAARARKTLADASKARWHEQERALLEQVEVELLRCRGPHESERNDPSSVPSPLAGEGQGEGTER